MRAFSGTAYGPPLQRVLMRDTVVAARQCVGDEQQAGTGECVGTRAFDQPLLDSDLIRRELCVLLDFGIRRRLVLSRLQVDDDNAFSVHALSHVDPTTATSRGVFASPGG